MADHAMTYRLVVKQIAMQHGVYATFMPKPIFGQNGSGMHTHQSLFQGDKNAFFDPNDKYHLSKTAKSYIAGILKHAGEICSIIAQWVNSYKRLVPGYEAPVYIAWHGATVRHWSGFPCTSREKKRPHELNFDVRTLRATLTSPSPSCWPRASRALKRNTHCQTLWKRTSTRCRKKPEKNMGSSRCPGICSTQFEKRRKASW